MAIDVARYFTYTVTVTSKIGNDITGEPLYSASPSSAAVWFEPTIRRWSRGGEFIETTDVSVLFLPSQAVAVGDKLTNLTDVNGHSVLTSGVIVDLSPSYHPADGMKMQDASVKKGTVG